MEPPLITIDSSGLIAILDRRDLHHAAVAEVFRRERPPYIVPAGSLGEVAYFLERWIPSVGVDPLLADIESGRLTLDCGEQDIPRIRTLVERYADLPLGFVDAAVIACAERNGGRVLTLDRRHFGVVGREGTIALLP